MVAEWNFTYTELIMADKLGLKVIDNVSSNETAAKEYVLARKLNAISI